MPTIQGKEYNDVLWKVAGRLIVGPLLKDSDCETAYIPEENQIGVYEEIREKLKTLLEQNGVPFDEKNLAEEGSVPEGPRAIHIRFKPGSITLLARRKKP